jgi:DNA-binding transcriptional MerR regulator
MSAESERRYRIGEVCRLADVQPYVLRYWETEFPPLAPGKSGGGQRLYTQQEVDIILRIKELLYKDGFTIAGAKKKLEAEIASPQERAAAEPEREPAAPRRIPEGRAGRMLIDVRRELTELLEMLRK